MPINYEILELLRIQLLSIQKRLIETEESFSKETQSLKKEIRDLQLSMLEIFDLAEKLSQSNEVSDAAKVKKKLSQLFRKHAIRELVVFELEPHLVKVVDSVTDGGKKSGEIISVFRKGFAAGDHILRPAEVITQR